MGKAREALKEEVDRDLDPREKLAFPVVDPAWRTSTDIMAKVSGVAGISLALRHSGYGWLCFLLPDRSEEHTSELQSLMRISYAVFGLKKKKQHTLNSTNT